MDEPKKYSLGNKPEEYVLSESYLGWMPVNYETWSKLIFDDDGVLYRPRPIRCELEDIASKQRVVLTLHQVLIKDAFPLEFFGEERAQSWDSFAIISLEEEPDTRFIIPLH